MNIDLSGDLMRGRRFFVFVVFAFLFFLCGCGKLPQTAILPPFSADLSFACDETAFDGVFTLKNSENMQLMLRTPTELRGLRFVFTGGKTVLQFGDAAVSLDDAEALGLPPAAVQPLFQVLSELSAAPQTLSKSGTAVLSTSRGTAVVSFMTDRCLPAEVTIGNLKFAFKNQTD